MQQPIRATEKFMHARRGAGALRPAAAVLTGLAVLGLGACSGGSGAPTEQNPASAPPSGGSSYTGPAPQTDDVQSFKINLWDNVSADNRCGDCHSDEGGQSPMFARRDDVNLAYGHANDVVTLSEPADSVMVTKVASGHNCWLASADACADILTNWIEGWAGELAAGAARKIELEPPPIRDPGTSRNFPGDAGLFQSTVHPVLEEHCSSCHASGSAVQQSPFFAEGPGSDSEAVAAAYEAAKARIDLDEPAASRFVARLREEGHNCWTESCANDADAMQSAIQAFADGVEPSQVDPSLVTSKAITLYEGTIASGGNRYEANVIASYEFKTGTGLTAFDTSGVDPAMDLTLSGNVEWFGGWGLDFSGGKAQASTASSAKLREHITATGEYSIEAWVAPGNVVQENARIVSYSAGPMARNFNLGQQMYDYEFYNRSSTTDGNGQPAARTPAMAEVLQATLQHVVATYDPVEGRRIYVNGALVSEADPAPGGALASWDDTFAFVLGNEVSGDRPFEGVIRLAAIHNRVLSQDQIVQNFEAGVGEKFFLLFSVEHLTDVPQSYVVFEAAVFDTHAYLFREPFFISLDNDATPAGLDIEGIRIGINGGEAPVGQAFANLDEVVTGESYDSATGQQLSRLGTVVPLEKGPDSDEFFLTFDTLGDASFARPAPSVPSEPRGQDLPVQPKIGVRTFDEINATMAEITGVSPLEPNVHDTYTTVRETLPAVPQVEAVLSSHQVAIAQLAIEYCNALVEDDGLRSTTFPGFPWGSPPSVAFTGANRELFFDPLLDRMLGSTQIDSQPDRAAVESELANMIDGYSFSTPGEPDHRPGLRATGSDTADRTEDIAKAVCSAVTGSAAMLVQ